MKIKKLIICDDDQSYCDSLGQHFLRKKWILEKTRTLDNLIKKLREESDDYFAIILDIKGLIDDFQAEEHASFIGTALTFLDKNHPGIPRVILSGEKSDFQNVQIYHQNEKVFQKEPEEQEALEKLLNEYADNSEIYKIRAKEPELYEIFDKGYLKNGSKPKLDNVIKHMHDVEKMPSGQLFNQCRELMEDIFTALNAKSDTYIPNEFFSGEEVNHTYCIRYLNGQDVKFHRAPNTVFQDEPRIPKHVFSALNTIKYNSAKGLHTGSNKPTNYTEMTTIYATLDFVKWFKDFMDSKDPYKEN